LTLTAWIAVDRVSGNWTDNTTGVTVNHIHHYTGDTDNPAWTSEDGVGAWSRVISGIGGMAGVYRSSTSTVDWQLTNLHGDLVASVPTGDVGLAATFEATEYGGMRDPANTGTRRYGWLGAKQRTADSPSGLILMGVRLYDPGTGRFLSTDPCQAAAATRTTMPAAIQRTGLIWMDGFCVGCHG
jgi:RHS repeat-associated protein